MGWTDSDPPAVVTKKSKEAIPDTWNCLFCFVDQVEIVPIAKRLAQVEQRRVYDVTGFQSAFRKLW